jgi:2-polyprenyl-3-methyl-5-hydroxy-6-metoxy-1,4-benzoquinol methylase
MKQGIVDETPCWCNESNWIDVFHTRKFGLVRCPSCGTFRIDPPPVQNDEEGAQFYTEYYDNKKHEDVVLVRKNGTRNSRFWLVWDKCLEIRTVGKSAVDIGSGDGRLCNELREAGWQSVVGIDVSRPRVAIAKKRYPEITFFDTPLDKTGVAPHSFDLITMDNVIEHLPDPVAFLKVLREYATPGGKLVMITPNMESGLYRLLGRRWTPELAPHAHIFLFTADSLSKLASRAGFEVVTASNIHIPGHTGTELLEKYKVGGAKGFLFSAANLSGHLYGRAIGQGPMIYCVAGA